MQHFGVCTEPEKHLFAGQFAAIRRDPVESFLLLTGLAKAARFGPPLPKQPVEIGHFMAIRSGEGFFLRCCRPNLREIKFTSQVSRHKSQSPTFEGLLMTLPIGAYGLLVGLFGLIAIGSGIWLVAHARDVARLDSDVVAGRARRPPASRGMTRAVLIIAIFSTIAALVTFALVATRAVDSDDTRTDSHAQRP